MSERIQTSIGVVFFRENSTLSLRSLMDRLATLVPRTRLFSCWLVSLLCNDGHTVYVEEDAGPVFISVYCRNFFRQCFSPETVSSFGRR